MKNTDDEKKDNIRISKFSLEKVDEIGAKKVSKIQPLIDDTIVFSSTGNTTNESFEFNTKIWYNVRAAQGVTINSISITSNW